MIEYIYNIIKASAGENVEIAARIVDENGNAITEQVYFHLWDKDEKEMLISAPGKFVNEAWEFVVPGEQTKELKGRYLYCIGTQEKSLCFKEPFYLV